MRVLLVGNRYHHSRSGGDKNFWFELVKHVSPLLGEIHILSLDHAYCGGQLCEPSIWIHRARSRGR